MSRRPEHLEVSGKGKLVGVGGADNQIKFALVILGVLLVMDLPEIGCTHLHRVGLLARAVRDGDDFFGAQSFGEEQAKVAQTADSDNTDFLGRRATAVLLERAVDRHTTTQHGRSDRMIESVRDLDGKVSRSAVVVGVASVGLGTFRVGLSVILSAVSSNLATIAVRLAIVLAMTAVQATVVLSTNSHDVADFDVLDSRADSHRLAEDFVSDDLRPRLITPTGARGVAFGSSAEWKQSKDQNTNRERSKMKMGQRDIESVSKIAGR